jgi:hypothetical protein
MSKIDTLPRFRTDADARKHVAYLRAEQVIDEATARRYERQLAARRRVARVLVTGGTIIMGTVEGIVLVGGIFALVLLAASL